MSNVYCTLAQMIVRFDARTAAELSNDAGSTSQTDANAQAMLDDAASELESHLYGRYSLPLASVPDVLTRWVLAVAVRNFYMRRGAMPEGVKEEYTWAMEWIDKVTNRVIGIPGIDRSAKPNLVSSERTDGRSRFDPGAAHFDRNNPQDTSTGNGEPSF